ncbi:hypothetical protein Anapl_08709 [Anas platyrhynchos]|uniref:Uncharacterized protein n=1 Tax=Anas platyrhynchos TaxID=8839 RepID=R0JW16_ANAPL|nr:hypothetical protein Anapl_08709 [Anas platyrhynchos]
MAFGGPSAGSDLHASLAVTRLVTCYYLHQQDAPCCAREDLVGDTKWLFMEIKQKTEWFQQVIQELVTELEYITALSLQECPLLSCTHRITEIERMCAGSWLQPCTGACCHVIWFTLLVNCAGEEALEEAERSSCTTVPILCAPN